MHRRLPTPLQRDDQHSDVVQRRPCVGRLLQCMCNSLRQGGGPLRCCAASLPARTAVDAGHDARSGPAAIQRRFTDRRRRRRLRRWNRSIAIHGTQGDGRRRLRRLSRRRPARRQRHRRGAHLVGAELLQQTVRSQDQEMVACRRQAHKPCLVAPCSDWMVGRSHQMLSSYMSHKRWKAPWVG